MTTMEQDKDLCNQAEAERKILPSKSKNSSVPLLGNKLQRHFYFNFEKVYEIFPETPIDVVCQISELRDFSPSKLLSLVPSATGKQISSSLKLVEISTGIQNQLGTPLYGKKDQTDIVLSGSRESTSLLIKQKKQVPTGATDEVMSDFVKSSKTFDFTKDNAGGMNSLMLFTELQSKYLKLLSKAKPSTEIDAENFENIFQRVQFDNNARSRIENIHAARAFKYGHTHLGEKSWYRESPNLAKKLKKQADRRKFRIGLKSDVDFINQLNIMDFERILQQGEDDGLNQLDMTKPVKPELLFKSLKNVPPIKILQLFNKQTATDILSLLSKISSMAHFSQSMADFYALDDALEPALAVVCEALRNNDDVSAILGKRGTFLGLAHSFQKYRSPQDHDAVVEQKRSKISSVLPKIKPSTIFCYHFQKNDSCYRKRCSYKHKCARYGSRNHGERNCGRKSLLRKVSSRRSRQ